MRLIIGYDGSPEAKDALSLGRMLARAAGAEVLLATVLCEAASGSWDDPQGRAGPLFSEALPQLAGLRVEVRAMVGSPAQRLHELARTERADVICLGATHRGVIGRVHPGSVADVLLNGATAAVAVAPRGYRGRTESSLRSIAVGYDQTLQADAALRAAERLAREAGASLRILAVLRPLSNSPGRSAYLPEAREEVQRWLDHAIETVPAELHAAGMLLEGGPAEILGRESASVDLLIVGSRARGPLRRVLLGGVSSRLVRIAQGPVLIVPRVSTGGADEVIGLLPAADEEPALRSFAA